MDLEKLKYFTPIVTLKFLTSELVFIPNKIGVFFLMEYKKKLVINKAIKTMYNRNVKNNKIFHLALFVKYKVE